MTLQNHYGIWSAVKDHPKIKDDETLETSLETFLRELFEELSIKLKISKHEKTITKGRYQSPWCKQDRTLMIDYDLLAFSLFVSMKRNGSLV